MSLIKKKWNIMILTACLAVVSAIFVSQIRINSDIETYLPDHIPSKMNNDSIERIFGKKDPLMLVFECENVISTQTLNRLKQINDELVSMPDFTRVVSLIEAKRIRGGNGMMIVEPVVGSIPANQIGLDSLRKQILLDNNIYQHLVSGDFTHTFILLNVDSDKTDKEIIHSVFNTIRKFPGKEKVYLNGPIYMRSEANQKITRDFMVLLPFGLLLMVIFLYFSFRQKRAVFLPFAVVILSILVCLALIPAFGWKLSIIGILIPVMMIAIANDYGIHFITKYQELSVTDANLTEEDIVIKTTKYLKKPVVMTGITTILGLLGLALHSMIPAKQMGVIASIGIGLALLLSLTFIPAFLILIRKKSNDAGFFNHRSNYLNKILQIVTKIVLKRPALVVAGFAICLILAGIGLNQMDIASNFDNILNKKHAYSIALRKANQFLGGTKNISLLFEGDIKDPSLLSRMDRYESELEKIPEIGSVTSIATLILQMSKAMNDPSDSAYNKIPATREAVAQYLELFSMSGDPEDLEDFVDFDYRHALMEVQFKTMDNHSIRKIEKIVAGMVQNDEDHTVTGGYCLIERELSDAIAKGQLYSLLFAFFTILILLAIIFRSMIAGLFGGLPLLFAVVCTFGIMGWAGIKLDIVTALLSSISIGLGVDYTIHMFWRIKKEIQIGSDMNEAITNSIRTTGYGVTINALSVIIGFAVLLFSAFTIIRAFAFLLILSISFCLLCSVLLIPALIIIMKPAFLFKKNKNEL